ncbi:MAG: retropepsin-like aspartic protease family protein [Gammaproteobacteria bacterium]
MIRKVFAVLCVLAVCLVGRPPAAWAATSVELVGLSKDVAIMKINGRQRVLRAGRTSPEGVELKSADAEAAVLVIDGVIKRMTLSNKIASFGSEPLSKPRVTSSNLELAREVTIQRDRSGMFTTIGSINGRSIPMMLDTGATLVSMSSVDARALGINYRRYGRRGRVSTASGMATAWTLTLRRVAVGELELRDVQATVVDGRFPEVVLLGNSYLSRLRMEQSNDTIVLSHEQDGARD